MHNRRKVGVVESISTCCHAVQIGRAQRVDTRPSPNQRGDRCASEFAVNLEGEIACQVVRATKGAADNIDKGPNAGGLDIRRNVDRRKREFGQFSGNAKNIIPAHWSIPESNPSILSSIHPSSIFGEAIDITGAAVLGYSRPRNGTGRLAPAT